MAEMNAKLPMPEVRVNLNDPQGIEACDRSTAYCILSDLYSLDQISEKVYIRLMWELLERCGYDSEKIMKMSHDERDEIEKSVRKLIAAASAAEQEKAHWTDMGVF